MFANNQAWDDRSDLHLLATQGPHIPGSLGFSGVANTIGGYAIRSLAWICFDFWILGSRSDLTLNTKTKQTTAYSRFVTMM